MKAVAFLFCVACLSGCMTAQQRADRAAGLKAAAQAKIIAAQVREAVKGIKPVTTATP